MKASDLLKLGIPREAHPEAFAIIRHDMESGSGLDLAIDTLKEVVRDPKGYLYRDPLLADLAAKLLEIQDRAFVPRETPAPYRVWGRSLMEKPGPANKGTSPIAQMEAACELPVAVRGALMPDAHSGYGLPIGGVLATDNAVIPYAVGVDIGCRMKLTVLDLPIDTLWEERGRARLRQAILDNTVFGMGAERTYKADHRVLDEDWSEASPVAARMKDRAAAQLGTSGSGNHFVEIGEFGLTNHAAVVLDMYPQGDSNGIALLSHSGSRGAGATIAKHFSRKAAELRPDLPKHLRHLAWLDLGSDLGEQYWRSMQLMGRYAAANHDVIHARILEALGAQDYLMVEHAHNFAWRETHDDRKVIVHRKGATPAAEGQLGVIPATMVDVAYLVMGRGDTASLCSASHGAGRKMSRKAAERQFTWDRVNALLQERGIDLLSAGLDQAPGAFKSLNSVMHHQRHLVRVMGEFQPRIVRMAEPGERPED